MQLSGYPVKYSNNNGYNEYYIEEHFVLKRYIRYVRKILTDFTSIRTTNKTGYIQPKETEIETSLVQQKMNLMTRRGACWQGMFSGLLWGDRKNIIIVVIFF